MPASTPIARSKTAALTRALDLVSRGYTRAVQGTLPPEKVVQVVRKLHARHALGATPAQRLTRKSHKLANSGLAIYAPDGAVAEWLLLFTAGELSAPEPRLHSVLETPKLLFLGYELVRHPARGRAAWTWRRPKAEMADHYAMLDDALKRRRWSAVAAYLERLANQPGFHGVREQTWALGQYVARRGYRGELPHLFYVQKVPHGERMALA